MRPAILAACLLMMGTGCVENAILEIEIQLPPLATSGVGMECPASPVTCPAGTTCVDGNCQQLTFALTQVRQAAAHPFGDTWSGTDLEAIELESGSVIDEISVVTCDPEMDVHVKVRFCTSPSCVDLSDADAPEVRVQIEHPFYVGQRTSVLQEIASIPAETVDPPIVVDKCAVRGCVTGEIGNFCHVGTNTHLCE